MFVKKSAYNSKLYFHSFARKRPRKGSQLIDFQILWMIFIFLPHIESNVMRIGCVEYKNMLE